MITECMDIAIQFSELPYRKKICFIPFDIKKTSLIYVDIYNNKENKLVMCNGSQQF